MTNRGRRKLRSQDSEWSQFRVAADVSIRDLEVASGVHRTILSMLERGRYLPTPQEADQIISALKRLQAEKASVTIHPGDTGQE